MDNDATAPRQTGPQRNPAPKSARTPRRPAMTWLPGLRKLAASEAPLLTAHLLRLDPADRVQRFGGHAGAERIARYTASKNSSRGVRVGFFDHGCLRGCGELYLFPAGAAIEAEFALSVESRWQHQGVGTRLLASLVVAARNRNVATLHMHCRADNVPMRRLARALRIRQSVRWDEVHGTLVLEAPDPWSLTRERFIDGATWARRLWAAAAPATATCHVAPHPSDGPAMRSATTQRLS